MTETVPSGKPRLKRWHIKIGTGTKSAYPTPCAQMNAKSPDRGGSGGTVWIVTGVPLLGGGVKRGGGEMKIGPGAPGGGGARMGGADAIGGGAVTGADGDPITGAAGGPDVTGAVPGAATGAITGAAGIGCGLTIGAACAGGGFMMGAACVGGGDGSGAGLDSTGPPDGGADGGLAMGCDGLALEPGFGRPVFTLRVPSLSSSPAAPGWAISSAGAGAACCAQAGCPPRHISNTNVPGRTNPMAIGPSADLV